MLREHVARFGVGPDGRIFRSERGNPIQASTWWQVWQKVRAASLTPEELDGPLMRQSLRLRHAGVTGGSTRAWTRPPSPRGWGTRWRSCAASTITRSAGRTRS